MEEKALLEIVKKAKNVENLLEYVKQNNLEYSEETVRNYFDLVHKTGEISDNELDNVAGGGCHASDGRLIVTIHHVCQKWQCQRCWRDLMVTYSCPACKNGTRICCSNCKHMSYESGVWYCNHAKNRA